MRRFIIHLLGGYTQDELNEQKQNCVEIGLYQAFLNMREEIRKRYGMPAGQQLAELWTWLSDKIDGDHELN